MADVFVDLIPLILGATLAPVLPIIVLLLLQSERGLGKAIAIVAGAVTVRLLQGVVLGWSSDPLSKRRAPPVCN